MADGKDREVNTQMTLVRIATPEHREGRTADVDITMRSNIDDDPLFELGMLLANVLRSVRVPRVYGLLSDVIVQLAGAGHRPMPTAAEIGLIDAAESVIEDWLELDRKLGEPAKPNQ